MRRYVVFILLVLFLACLLPTAAAQQVLYRARIGNYTDAATFIPSGPFAQHIVMLDQYEVLAFPAQGAGQAPARKLFDTFDLTVGQPFRGMAYISTEKLFVFLDNARPDVLILADPQGRPAGTRTITYPDGDPYHANRFEGIVHIPPTALIYPDHLVALSFCTTSLGPCGTDELRILVMKRDGTVVKQFHPSDQILGDLGEFWGIGFQAPGTLLCSGGGPYIWKMDFDGNLLGDYAYTGLDSDSPEGIMQLPNGKVAVTNGYGKVKFFAADFTPLPQFERDYTIGLGIPGSYALDWNTDTNQFLISESFTGSMWTVTPTLSAKGELFPMTAFNIGAFYPPPERQVLNQLRFRTMSYRPDAHQIAFTYTTPNLTATTPPIPSRVRLVQLDNSGTLTGYSRLFDWDQPQELWTRTFSYIPPGDFSGTEEYILRSFTNSQVLEFVRPGQPGPDATLDLSSLGLSLIAQVQYYKPGPSLPGHLLVVDNNNRAVIVTLNGTKLAEFDYHDKLRIWYPADFAYITSGPYAGAMAVLAADNSEIVIFRVP